MKRIQRVEVGDRKKRWKSLKKGARKQNLLAFCLVSVTHDWVMEVSDRPIYGIRTSRCFVGDVYSGLGFFHSVDESSVTNVHKEQIPHEQTQTKKGLFRYILLYYC
jgi:hypothetical protein